MSIDNINELKENEIKGILLENWFITHIDNSTGLYDEEINNICSLIEKEYGIKR